MLLWQARKRRDESFWMPTNERRHLSIVHRASGRTQCTEQTWALESTGLGHASGHNNLRAIFSLTHDFNLPQFQLPHLEYGDNNPYLIGSLWEFKARGTECLAPNRCPLYICICVHICVCTHTGARHSVPLVLHFHKDHIHVYIS